MKGKLYLLCALLLLYSPIFAQQVSLETAQRVANMFLRNNMSAAMRSASATNTTNSSASVIKPIGKVAQSPVMYAVSQDSVWVLVSADERVTPILAYSDANAGAFPNEEDMPDGMKALLDWYEFQIQYLRDSTNINATHEDWQEITSNYAVGEVTVGPLLFRDGKENKWNQSGNNDTINNPKRDYTYNKFCPVIEFNDSVGGILIKGSHTLVGCVAVAMGQLMWYWQWPNITVVEDANGHTVIREYDWNNMPAEITNSTPVENVDAVALLLREVGISVNMEYLIGGSGTSTGYIPDALDSKYHYHTSNVINRNNYRRNLLDSVRANITKGYPVLYGGEKENANSTHGTHQFIIDGYKKADFASQPVYHINYGWGGKSNGYYYLDEINGEACTEYSLNQIAILNVYPNYPNCEPIEISQDEILDTVFVIQNGGGITIGNNVIENYQDGVIYSGEYVTLTAGFHAKVGSNLHITINDVPCGETHTISHLPNKTNDTSYKDQWCDTWNVLSHGWYGPTDDPYMPHTLIYQLDEDTTINNLAYQTLTGCFSLAPLNEKYVAALRFAENKKVFVHYNNTEYLLYDFGAQVGDTLEIFGGIEHYKDFKTLPHIITGIDTLEDGRLQIHSEAIIKFYEGTESEHERLYPKIWIEGIGSKDGIVQNSATNRVGSGVTALLCAYREESCAYTTDEPYYAPYGCVYNDPIFTATEEVSLFVPSVQKIIYNSQLLIIRDGKTYNVMGVEVGK